MKIEKLYTSLSSLRSYCFLEGDWDDVILLISYVALLMASFLMFREFTEFSCSEAIWTQTHTKQSDETKWPTPREVSYGGGGGGGCSFALTRDEGWEWGPSLISSTSFPTSPVHLGTRMFGHHLGGLKFHLLWQQHEWISEETNIHRQLSSKKRHHGILHHDIYLSLLNITPWYIPPSVSFRLFFESALRSSTKQGTSHLSYTQIS